MFKVLAEATSVVCKQADRLALSSADKEKIHTKAVAGLDPKFSVFHTYDGEEQLELTHSLSIQFILLEQRLMTSLGTFHTWATNCGCFSFQPIS